jgi:ferrous iron transport protein B
MDRLMHRIGLHGRSVVPLVLGFGCSVPAIMAARTIENPKDRLVTIMVTPLMSCGARLPIYVLLAGAFFSAYQGLVIFSMYFIGVVLAILLAWLFRKKMIKGESGHFVMELPPYRLPTVKGTLIYTWIHVRAFLARAGTIIFLAVMLFWLLDYTGVVEPVSKAIAPVFSPAGFGQWQRRRRLSSACWLKKWSLAPSAPCSPSARGRWARPSPPSLAGRRWWLSPSWLCA